MGRSAKVIGSKWEAFPFLDKVFIFFPIGSVNFFKGNDIRTLVFVFMPVDDISNIDLL